MTDSDAKLQITETVMQRVRERFAVDGSGHGIDHIMRVYRMAIRIAEEESCDAFIVALAALLHDVGDHKLTESGNENHRNEIAALLDGTGLSGKQVNQIIDIVEKVSFKGNGVEDAPLSHEGRCVRDSDRLDAMGSIGIARAFAYGALKGRPMFDAGQKPGMYDSFSDYKKNTSHTINHFYEKLLLLKDRMETAAGKRLAEGRHAMLEAFVSDFLLEWDAEK